MAKTKTFTPDDRKILSKEGMDWRFWVPLQQLPNSLIVKHRITGEVKLIEKSHIHN